MKNWVEILTPAFTEIKNTYFKNGDWFIDELRGENRVYFGAEKGERFNIYEMSANYLIVSSHTFKPNDDLVRFVLTSIQSAIKKEKLDVLIQGKIFLATGDSSEYVLDILEYTSEHLLKNRSMRMLSLGAYPMFSYREGVSLVYNRSDIVSFFENIFQARDFYKKEKEIEEKMITFEKDMDALIKDNFKDVSVFENEYDTSPMYLVKDKIIKFSLRQKYHKNKTYYEAGYNLGDTSLSFKDESIDILLLFLETEIKNYIKKIPA